MASAGNQGTLVIIGGAEDKENDCKILREFVRHSGGINAKIVVMTAATEFPREVGENYIRIFERIGAAEATMIDTADREDASSSSALEAIENATGIFFTGGDQARITALLKDTPLDEAIHKRFKEGATIGGTSAGAAVMPDIMIVEGDSETHPRINTVEMDRGMAFLPGVVIDQHFAQRGRLGRLVSALAQQPAVLGFGIDENTAMIVEDKTVTVIGEGAVTVINVADITHDNVEGLLKDEALAICGAKLHILPEGYRFNLETKKPILTPNPVAV